MAIGTDGSNNPGMPFIGDKIFDDTRMSDAFKFFPNTQTAIVRRNATQVLPNFNTDSVVVNYTLGDE